MVKDLTGQTAKNHDAVFAAALNIWDRYSNGRPEYWEKLSASMVKLLHLPGKRRGVGQNIEFIPGFLIPLAAIYVHLIIVKEIQSCEQDTISFTVIIHIAYS